MKLVSLTLTATQHTRAECTTLLASLLRHYLIWQGRRNVDKHMYRYNVTHGKDSQ